MTLYKIFNIAMIVIPTFITLILIINLFVKYKKNKKIDGELQKKIYWELPAIIISFYFTITGLFFDNFSSEINTKFIKIEESIQSSRHIVVNENPTISAINEEIENMIEELRKHHKHVIYIRTLNLPNPIIGKKDNQDHIIGKRFLGAAFSFEYYLCYPSLNILLNDKEFESRRKQMQLFLFKQLIQPIWNDFVGFQDKYKLHYIPIVKNYNSWTIRTSEEAESGYITFKGHWMDSQIHPERESLIYIQNEELKQIIFEENLNYNEIAENFYKSQLKLPVYNREPCMIFYSHQPFPSLRPIQIGELIKKIEKWISLWKYESGKNKPKSLRQLEEIKYKLIKGSY